MATKNLVPRNSGEGGIGRLGKSWATGFFDALYLNDEVVTTLSSNKNDGYTINQNLRTSDDVVFNSGDFSSGLTVNGINVGALDSRLTNTGITLTANIIALDNGLQPQITSNATNLTNTGINLQGQIDSFAHPEITGWHTSGSNHLLPAISGEQDIGAPQRRVRDIYLEPGSLYLGESNLSVDSNGSLVFTRGDGSTSAITSGTLSSALNGGGTANYVSKWSDSDTLTAGQIKDDGTRVGINGLDPSHNQKLQVHGDALLSGTLLVTGAGDIKLSYGAEEGESGGGISFGNEYNELVRITNGDDFNGEIILKSNGVAAAELSAGGSSYFMGKLGVGSSNPQHCLHITGDAFIGGNLTVTGTTTTLDSVTLTVDDKNIELGSVDTPSDITADGGGIILKGTTDKSILWENDTDSWDSSEHFTTADGKHIMTDKIRARDGDGLYIVDDGDIGIFIKDGGRVGIGNYNPTHELDTVGNIRFYNESTNHYPKIQGTTNEVGLNLDNSQGNWTLFLDDSALDEMNTGSLGFHGGTTPGIKMVLDGGGNVGIGTSDPQHKLHVYGDAIVSGHLYDSINSTGISGDVLTSRADGPQWNNMSNILLNTTIEKINVTQIIATTGTFNEVKSDNIVASGNISVSGTLTSSTGIFTSGVGIGTSTPSGLLHLVDDGQSKNLLIVEDKENDPTPFVITSGGQVGIGQPDPEFDVHVGTGAETALVVVSGGRVGVGTGDPTGLFHVVGATHEAWPGGDNHLMVVENQAASNSPFVVANNGKVGIGTPNPGEILVIKANSPKVKIQASMEGGAAELHLISDQDDDDADKVAMRNNDGLLTFRNKKGGSWTDHVYIDEDGQVGIGGAPSAKFRLVDGNEQNNYVLTSDANGNASWQANAGGGGASIEVKDEGVSLTTAVTKIDFVGDGVTTTEPTTDQIQVSVPNNVTEAFVMFTR